MKSTIVAIAAFAAAAAADSTGYVAVVNSCSDTVYVMNVPSADGVHKTQYATLSNGESYAQVYTELNDGAGWSLKMAYDDDWYNAELQIQQFEYTYQDEGEIWYDMSDVNGSPFSAWAFSSSDSTCKQTSDAFTDPTTPDGMQVACTSTANITMTLCSSSDDSSSSSSSAYSSVAASTASPASSSVSTPSAYIAESKSQTVTWGQVDAVASTTSASSTSTPTSTPSSTPAWTPSTTTFATSVITSAPSSSNTDDIVWVTDVAYTTEFVTAAKRDLHRHQHHARHPHGARA